MSLVSMETHPVHDKTFVCATMTQPWDTGEAMFAEDVKKVGTNLIVHPVTNHMWERIATYCVTPSMRDTMIRGMVILANSLFYQHWIVSPIIPKIPFSSGLATTIRIHIMSIWIQVL